MTYFPYLGGEIARLREAKGLSPQKLAEQLGLRDITILNLEAGKFFKPEIVEQILNYFGCRLAIAPIDNSSQGMFCAEAQATYQPGTYLPGLDVLFNPKLRTQQQAESLAAALANAPWKKPTCIEICAGAGGQALGLEMAGFEHVALIEYESDYCNALRKNRPDWNVICCDVKDFSGKPFAGRIDLLAGGVPCPPFSKAGKQLGSEDERDLFPEAIRLVDEIRPKAVMLENVRGLLDPVFDEYRESILRKIADLGYKVDIKLLHASDYGVPQLRPRVVIIGIRNDVHGNFQYPEPQMESTPTVASTLLDLMKTNGWKGADEWAKGADKIAPTVVGGSKKHGGPDLGPARAG
ncbi:MAG: DNA (cytosine-5-)-methyltransferase, partial [Victivallales bacterium]|nr:DNA (cytosine-5-)-methyltransferase [Victivallales bacterium]